MFIDLFKLFTSPFTLLFLVLAIGNLLAKVKIKKFKFGISGNLFTGLFVGWLVVFVIEHLAEGSKHYAAGQALVEKGLVPSAISHLFLYIFIAAVGLLSAKDLGTVLKRYGLKFVSLALIITLSGGLMVYALRPYMGTGVYEMSGVYTAAMTSSPGLAAALESTETSATKLASQFPELSDRQKDRMLKVLDADGSLNHENTTALTADQKEKFVHNAVATTGASNAIGFPFGVIIVILSMTIIPKLFRVDVEKEKELFEIELAEMKKSNVGGKVHEECFFDLAAFAFTIFVGFVLGSLKIYMGPLGYFSLGSTGGILISSLTLGHFAKLGRFNFRMNPKVLAILKDLGLGSFVAFVGISYGYKVVNSLFSGGIVMSLFALFIAFTCMCIGFIVGKYVFKINWVMLSGAICGSMTATPGLGAAIDALGTNEAGAGYAATYPFALIAMVLFTIILNNLPL